MAEIDETLEHLLVLGVPQVIGGSLVLNGQPVTGVASYTWAQFIDASFDLTVARFVHVSDRHSTTDGTSTPGSLWRIDPAATAIRKRNLVSGAIYYSNLSDAPSPITWPTLKIFARNIGLSGAIMTSDGAHYRSDTPYITLANNLSLISRAKGSSPDINIEWQPLPVRLYRDINNECVMQDGDYLSIHTAWTEKTGTADALNVQVRFGTLNTTSDTSLLSSAATAAASNTQRIIKFMEIVRISNVAVNIRGGQTTTFTSGPLALTRSADITVPNMDSSSDSYLNIGMYIAALTDTALGLREYEVRLVKGN